MESGISHPILQIKMLMEHVYHGTGKLILIEISHLQMDSGISHPILQIKMLMEHVYTAPKLVN